MLKLNFLKTLGLVTFTSLSLTTLAHDGEEASLDQLISQQQSYQAHSNISKLALPAIDWKTQNLGNFNPQAYLPNAMVGLYAVDLTTNKVILSYNAQANFKPASTNKVITALLTASKFDYNQTLETRAFIKVLSNGEVDLTLEFTGDPSFNSQSVNTIVNNLLQRGVKRIRNLVLNLGKYTGHDRPQGWVWNGNSMCYSSENTVAQFNYNCIAGTLKTDGTLGTIAPMQNYANSREIKITSQVKIVSPSQAQDCELNYINAQGTSFTLDGCVAQNKQGIWMYFAVPNGNQFTAQVIRNALASKKITVGKMSYSTQLLGNKTVPSFTIKSLPIGSLIENMLSRSENHIAEQLYRNLAFVQTSQPVSYTLANRVNRDLLRSLGIGVDPTIYDGSGLSYYNNATPLEMTKIVTAIYTNNQALGNLWQLFPQQDQGTLQHKKAFQIYQIQGKTGSLNGVTNFTGIITTSKGKKIAFTYFINNSNDNKAQIEAFESKLLAYLNAQ
ncbi:D-alanyl-D-alanine carboxypeptidase/D-alanyl-D-alanine endopeptidase [Psittacicella gerlachiana]|uniref:D-alanyl-D-alanine carboxypeptidase/D-alanyl-D-alanine-endopeptidase n=1 Tax=Psittacicella gerlachiana TaxID=2028574 RepID=A0A3A1YC57_9GAMM|nr:D-alanyl-D-alanine carboxypeptidase/D-alanyl-D-alanine-endopeptidase [Psittacicella gerlachiana]RIY34768.1 D-alanyl-D-alanine carboxypeptidase/D-alanyl-D-alanine-endopeptidase [Psittacicella gerlachiana]